MDTKSFWELIDRTRESANGDSEKQAELLVEQLTTLGVDAIFYFDHIHLGLMNRAYDCAVWDAAYCIESCGDDSFSDFRAWLIAQGENVYETVLADPSELINIVELGQRTQVENLQYVAMRAYERVTGDEDMPPFVYVVPELKGKFAQHCWERYPELYAKFHPDD